MLPIPGHLKNASDRFTKALLAALDEEDQELARTVQACIDQLFLATASGRYLVKLGEQEGFTMPTNSGLDIRAYRTLVPVMVSAPKQIRRTIDELIRAFYGRDRVSPFLLAQVAEPYNLSSGDDLIIETESGTARVAILDTQVSDITSVSATELSAIFNSLQSLFQAETFTERGTGLKYLRFISRAEGSSAFIRVAGGTMQNVLKVEDNVPTTLTAGTNWNIEKVQSYSDVTRFTWDGTGTNPGLYQVKLDDVVTIRGLSGNLSELNGSYTVLDVGYNYFVIRNESWPQSSALYVQDQDNSIHFTSQKKIRISDKSEYALSAETSINTATATVPAIPPLARRFLQGSAHLHGAETGVLSFTRGSITVEGISSLTLTGANAFVLSNDRNRWDFSKKYYRSYAEDGNTNPTMLLETDNDLASVLPPTTPLALPSGAIYARPQSEEFVLRGGTVRHGLLRGWGFTLTGVSGTTGNITDSQLNKEHVVFTQISENDVAFRLYDSNGNTIKFSGVNISGFDVVRGSTQRSDDGDFYLEFADSAAVLASGLGVGSVFRLDNNLGTNIDAYYGNRLRLKDLEVVAIEDERVWFRGGFGPGVTGLIITGGVGYRDATFPGSVTFFFDQASDYNQKEVMSSLRASFWTFEDLNKDYIGSFIYDPQGVETTVTVSGFVAKTSQPMLKGSNDNIVFVEDVNDIFNGESFPSTGSLVIGYGTEKFEGPIRYIATISGGPGMSQIVLDPSYRFKFSHDVGTNMQYIRANVPYVPTADGKDYPVYLTGTAQARNTLFTLMELIIAAGIFLEADILFPELRYADVSVEPFA